MRLIAVAMTGMLASVQGQPGATIASVRWELTHLGADEERIAKFARAPHVVFTGDGAVTGWDGCNTIGGRYTVGDDTIAVEGLMGTLMSCSLPGRIDRRFREALVAAAKWRASDLELTLLDGQGAVLARLEVGGPL
jgi:heat shock protein HslJ